MTLEPEYIYLGADKAIQYLNRVVLKEFGKLRLLKMDELNVMRTVRSVYEKTALIAKKQYRRLSDDVFVMMLLLCTDGRLSEKSARAAANKTVNEKWMNEFLDKPNPVTKYSFDPETERKIQRTAEALLASGISKKEIDKAIRYWSQELGQYCIETVDAAILEAYRYAGITKVMWVSQRDFRVCLDCDTRDGTIYDIDSVPPKPHWGCRCELWPVKEE